MTRNHARFPRAVRLSGIVGLVGIGASVLWGSCSVYDESLLTAAPDSSAGASGSGGSVGSGASGGTDGSSGEDGGGSGGTGATAGTDGSGGTGAGGSGGGSSCPGVTGPWWTTTSETGCQVTGIPGPEGRPPESCEDADIPPIILATSHIRLGTVKADLTTRDDNAWKEIGLDLDGRCTLSDTCTINSGDAGDAGARDAGAVDGGDGGPTAPPVDERACTSNQFVAPFDGTQCRDNSLGRIFGLSVNSPEIGGKLGMNERNWNCALHRGEFATIIRVSEYNGKPDDPHVRVDNYSSTGVQNLPGWSCLVNGTIRSDWQGFAPWPPTSHWRITRRSLALNDTGTGTELPPSRYGDPNAYVRGGYVIAKLPAGTELWLNGERSHAAGFRNIIYRAVTIGKLVKGSDGTWSIQQGLISGVTFPTDIIQAFREIGYCENFCGSYNNIVSYVNIAQDALTGTDEHLPSRPCDGISMGIEFTARQVMADRSDLVDSNPVTCPNPRDPTLPRQGCVCQQAPATGCVLPDAGSDSGADGS
jgi:hypothetical protein